MMRMLLCTILVSLIRTNMGFVKFSHQNLQRMNIHVLSSSKIDSSAFVHPSDEKLTKRLANIPFLEPVIRRILTIAESVYYVELLSTSVKVSPQQYPRLHNILANASSALKIDPPDLFVIQNPVPNAYTLAIRGRKPFVVVHSSLVEILNDIELQAVIGHELGHLVCEHSIWVTAFNILSLGADRFLPTSISNTVRTTLYEWLRSAELSCDRAALVATKDINAVISMMIKLSGGWNMSNQESVNVEEFLRQAELYQEEYNKTRMIRRILLGSMEQQRTHPVPVMRAKQLYDWSNSAQYAGYIARNSNNS